MLSALKEKDSGFSVVMKDDRPKVRLDLGRGSFIDSDVCVFCEKEISREALKMYLIEGNKTK
jgi:hypothetical protein